MIMNSRRIYSYSRFAMRKRNKKAYDEVKIDAECRLDNKFDDKCNFIYSQMTRIFVHAKCQLNRYLHAYLMSNVSLSLCPPFAAHTE